MADPVTFSALNPRETAFHVVETLKRLRPQIVLGRFAQQKILPRKNTDIVKWVRYRKINNAVVLAEGVPPTGKTLQSDTITTKVEQIGDVIRFTDAALDLHPDDIMAEGRDVMDEQILDTMEKIYFDNIRGGSQQLFAGSATQRDQVDAAVSGTDLRQAALTLKKNNAKMITRILSGNVDFNTTPVEASYVGYTTPNQEPVMRDITGFETVEKYAGQTELFPGEFGKFENIRFITSTLADTPDLADTGNSSIPAGIDGGSAVNVSQIIIFGQDAYGGVPFAGPNALQLFVGMPKSQVGDELAQKAYLGWKTRFNAAVLQQKALVRIEVATPTDFA